MPATIRLDDLRIRLDQMTERIISRLKDRSRFPLNEVVYRPDAVPVAHRAGLSFLEHALEGLEIYHASLGRFAYPDQYPVFSSQLPESPVARIIGRPTLPPLQISIKDNLLAFYSRLLPDLCAPGDDTDTYGETVYVDADLLQLMNERINVGRYVAQAKLESDPAMLSVAADAETLNAKLRVPEREAALLAAVRRVAERYDLDPDLAERVFRWIIDETTRVEIEYLQKVATELPPTPAREGANPA